MKKFYWQGISSDERLKAIGDITHAVDQYATILNFQRFSDVMLSMLVEVEECKVNSLYQSLKYIMIVEGFEDNVTNSNSACLIFLSVTFTKGTGDLKIEVPNIPE